MSPEVENEIGGVEDALEFAVIGRRIIEHVEVYASLVRRFFELLDGDIGKGGRVIHSKERKGMARCRYQDGHLFIRGRKRKVWVARWREDVIQSDGSVQRVLRSEVLGPVSELAAQRQAVDQLENQLFPNVPKFSAEEEMPRGLIQ